MNAKTVDLGWCMAKYNGPKDRGPKLTIVSPSDGSETGFNPSESITIWSDEALIKLRDFLIEVLPKPEVER